ncbi:MAG: hypothetical protein ACYDAZ_08875 [Thermoplasmataceae archaeon]
MTVRRYEEIQHRLAEGRGVREIAHALGCSRRTVREMRDGARRSPDAPRALPDPLWMAQVDWPAIIHDLGFGHPLKFLWEEKAKPLTSDSNFWKPFYRKFPQYRGGHRHGARVRARGILESFPFPGPELQPVERLGRAPLQVTAETLDGVVVARKAIVVDKLLVDRHGIAPEAHLRLDPVAVGLTGRAGGGGI